MVATIPTFPTCLEPHQARERKPTAHEDLLGDSIERAYAPACTNSTPCSNT